MEDLDKLITPAEAARRKGVSHPTIYSAIADGRLPGVHVLGRLALREDDVEAWEPINYAGRPGVKGRGGRPRGTPATPETRARLAEAQRHRWAKEKSDESVKKPAEVGWRGFRNG